MANSKQKKIFIICPVRNIDRETENKLSDYVAKLEKEGLRVHWPPRDTNQDDPIGTMICKENTSAILNADEVHVWFDKNSRGSLFDFGITFVLSQFIQPEKKIVIINKKEVYPTSKKSFQNILLELEKASQ